MYNLLFLHKFKKTRFCMENVPIFSCFLFFVQFSSVSCGNFTVLSKYNPAYTEFPHPACGRIKNRSVQGIVQNVLKKRTEFPRKSTIYVHLFAQQKYSSQSHKGQPPGTAKFCNICRKGTPPEMQLSGGVPSKSKQAASGASIAAGLILIICRRFLRNLNNQIFVSPLILSS